MGCKSKPVTHAIGVDIGGNSAKLGIVSDAGKIIFRQRVATPTPDQPELVAKEYAHAIHYLLDRCREMAIRPIGIGVGMPGHISEDRRTSTFSNVHVLDNFPLVDFLSERFHLPVELDNDATLAALAEYRFGGGRGAKRLIVVTVGSGIGAGLIVDGKPQRPIRGCIGDPGHIIVAPESQWRCGCGCRGCLETVASSLAIEREATALAHRSPNSELTRVLNDRGTLSTTDVLRAAQEGDTQARRVLEQAGHWLGVGLVSWCYFFDPDLILIGGGVSVAGEILLSPIRQVMAEVGMPQYVADVRIALAELGNDAGMIGAASLLLSSQQTRRNGE